MRYARTLIDKLVTNAGNVPTMTTERREHSPCIAGSLPCRRARQRLVGIRFFFLCSITIPFLLLCLSLPKSIVLLHPILEGVEESGGGGLSSCPLRDDHTERERPSGWFSYSSEGQRALQRGWKHENGKRVFFFEEFLLLTRQRHRTKRNDCSTNTFFFCGCRTTVLGFGCSCSGGNLQSGM